MIAMLGSLLGSRGGRMLGGMVGGRTGAMVGGMVGALVGGRRLGGAIGGLRNMVSGEDDAAAEGPPLTEEDAEMLVRVMANAAKADGRVDQDEIDAILGELGDATAEEQRFLSDQLAAPFVDGRSLAATIPADLSVDAYVVSVAALRIDATAETAYLRELAEALGIDGTGLGAIHDELGIPRI